ncbi:hypothetical protein PENSPDRAFT_759771 [Peniophora sp. CONT]|nr:hypothetical protein PENSPDRAFT_759771 [Peniophora sp. CONT]
MTGHTSACDALAKRRFSKHMNASNTAWREEPSDLMANLSAAQLQKLSDYLSVNRQRAEDVVVRRGQFAFGRVSNLVEILVLDRDRGLAPVYIITVSAPLESITHSVDFVDREEEVQYR